MFVVVCYDISSNRLRNKISKYLWKYWIRVQKSVFECEIEKEDYKELKNWLNKLLKKFWNWLEKDKKDGLKTIEETNTIRLYIIWNKQRTKIEVLWKGIDPHEVPSYVII